LFAGLAAATTLTSLYFDVPSEVADMGEGRQQQQQQHQAPVDACASIARLAGLKHLGLDELDTAPKSESWRAAGMLPGDVLALTALTGLTHLSLRCGGRMCH
jgi:hypothetical protein